MATIENFILRFKTEGASALNGLSNTLNQLGSSTGAAGDAITGLTSRLGPLGAAAGLAVTAFAGLGVKAVQIASQLSDISGATGIATSTLQSFKQSIIDAGGGAQDFGVIAAKLNQSVNEAAAGNETLQKAFENLGVYVRDAGGQIRPTEEILRDLVQRFQAGALSSQEFNAAIDILGKTVNKLELAKLRAINDPFVDAEIAQLDKYGEAWDKLIARLEQRLVSYAARIAEFLDLNRRMMTDAELAQQGLKRIPQTFWTAEKIVPMNQQELEQYKANQAEIQRLQARARAGTTKPTGDYGAASAQKLKEQADVELRIYKNALDERTAILLQFAKTEEDRINIRADKEIAYAQRTIGNERELASAVANINAQRDLDIATHRESVEKTANEKRLREEERLANEIRRLNERSQEAIANYRSETSELKKKFEIQANINKLGTIEAERQREIADIEKERKSLLNQIATLPNDQRLAREQEINAAIQERIGLINQEYATRQAREQDFAAGFQDVMRRYEESLTPLKRGQQLAESVFSNMDRALSNFVDTGKFNFKDFANSIIRDLILVELRANTVRLFQGIGSFLGLRANGGPVTAGQPYIVGEKGAELFVPSTSGNIISNAKLSSGGGGLGGSTNIVYNIQAVDAPSFQQLVARDPAFIYAVTQQGAKSLPSTRR